MGNYPKRHYPPRHYPPRHYPIISCKKCKEEIQKTGNRQIYCKKCKPEIEKKHYKKYSRKYRKNNEGHLKDYHRDYNNAHKKERKEYHKNYRKTTHGKKVMRKCARNRRNRKKTIIESFTKEEWYRKLLATKGICSKCKINVGIDKLTLNHIYPVIKAYKDFLKTGIKKVYTIKDIEPCCKNCNIRQK